MKDIIWKSVPNYEGLYEVSNTGKIKSFYKNRLLKDSLNCYGYYQVQLFKNKKYKQHLVHIIVASAFIDNYEKKPQVNHKNGIKTDNNVDNLEWATNAENMKHASDNGLLKGNNKSNQNAGKKVINTLTGETYSTLKVAAQKLKELTETPTIK